MVNTFYIQLIVYELKSHKNSVTKNSIDESFDLILDNRNHFDHWHVRLRSFIDTEYKFLKELLNNISERKRQSHHA